MKKKLSIRTGCKPECECELSEDRKEALTRVVNKIHNIRENENENIYAEAIFSLAGKQAVSMEFERENFIHVMGIAFDMYLKCLQEIQDNE